MRMKQPNLSTNTPNPCNLFSEFSDVLLHVATHFWHGIGRVTLTQDRSLRVRQPARRCIISYYAVPLAVS